VGFGVPAAAAFAVATAAAMGASFGIRSPPKPRSSARASERAGGL